MQIACFSVLIALFTSFASAGQGFSPAVTLSASSEQKEQTAAMAMDGKMDTRWASNANDNEWLRIDFNTPTELVGIRLHWETAYGRDYEIQAFQPDGQWQSINKVAFGDGGVDEIYFGLHKTKAIRLVGHKRGTGWGYSIWEVEFLGPQDRVRRRDNLKTLPVCAELGDFDPTSTSVGIMIADERDNLNPQALKATYDRYVDESRKRAAQPLGKRSSYTPYEVRNIGALIRLSRCQDARMLLDFFVQDRVRFVTPAQTELRIQEK